MKRSSLISIIIAFLLTSTILGGARAQNPVDLAWVVFKFWPEYDDPRLLVILDGQLSTPDQEVRLPIPADADVNAVAAANEQGRLLTNEWKEEKDDQGQRWLVFTPAFPAFRVEYYTALAMDGDKRIIDFQLPAGVFQAKTMSVEVLLPPSSKDVELDPSLEESGAAKDEAHLYQKELGALAADQPWHQKIVYKNPSGALTAPEPQASAPAANPAPAPNPEPAVEPAASSLTSRLLANPWMLLLAGVAVLFIVGGAVGLWLTRESEEELPAAPPAPRRGRKKQEVAPLPQGKLDRFCRNCGREFGPEDRFCRYCGTKRQRLE